jgi:hypothetical protein
MAAKVSRGAVRAGGPVQNGDELAAERNREGTQGTKSAAPTMIDRLECGHREPKGERPQLAGNEGGGQQLISTVGGAACGLMQEPPDAPPGERGEHRLQRVHPDVPRIGHGHR